MTRKPRQRLRASIPRSQRSFCSRCSAGVLQRAEHEQSLKAWRAALIGIWLPFLAWRSEWWRWPCSRSADREARPPSGVRPWTRPYLIWVAQLRFTQMAQEPTRLDYLHEVEHMHERVASLEQAIAEAVKLASPAIATSHQRSTGIAGYRRYLGSNHRGRVGPGVPL